MAGSLLLAGMAVAEDDWGADLNIYGWLPIIETELEDGTKDEITRDDILKDFDIAALWAARIRKGRWSLASDFVYLLEPAVRHYFVNVILWPVPVLTGHDINQG
jgi:hypothetical protein